MRKTIYGVTGVLSTAALYMLLSSNIPTASQVDASPGAFQIESGLSFNTFSNAQFGLQTTIFDGGTYQLSEEDYEMFRKQGVVTYGKPNPTFFYRYAAPAPVVEETPGSDPSASTLGESTATTDPATTTPQAAVGGLKITKDKLQDTLGYDVDKRAAVKADAYEAVTAFLNNKVHLPLDVEHYVETSAFGERSDPFTGEKALHSGKDYATTTIGGANVYSVSPGYVSYIEHSTTGYGNYVVVDHGEFKTAYAHLKEINVEVGKEVDAGTVLGTVGTTGRSTGNHLHFEFRIGNIALDPELFLSNLKIEKAE